MLSLFKARIKHGYQAIRNLKEAKIKERFRGLPQILVESVSEELERKLIDLCPTDAIKNKPLSIDLGRCIFCGACSDFVESSPIKFTNFHKIYSFDREDLIITSKTTFQYFNNLNSDLKIQKIFKNSFKIRNVSSGGCNGCELELSASFNVNFDISRFGVDIVASPRHADALLITGPMTENMKEATKKTWEAMPLPKVCILFGSCAISGGVFNDSKDLSRDFLKEIKPDLFIPGCPVHPLTFITAIKRLIGWGDNEP